MVKRIKKRVEKSEPDETTVDNEAPAEDQPVDFDQQMDALAEDQLTTVLAGWFKFVVRHKAMLLVAIIAVIAVFGAMTYYEHSNDEDRAAASDEVYAAFDTSKKAFKTDSSGKAPAVEKRTAALKQALQEFQAARDNNAEYTVSALAQLGEASVQYDLGEHGAAKDTFKQVAAIEDITTLVKMVALQGEAAAAEDAGDQPTAATLWKQIEELDPEARIDGTPSTWPSSRSSRCGLGCKGHLREHPHRLFNRS